MPYDYPPSLPPQFYPLPEFSQPSKATPAPGAPDSIYGPDGKPKIGAFPNDPRLGPKPFLESLPFGVGALIEALRR